MGQQSTADRSTMAFLSHVNGCPLLQRLNGKIPKSKAPTQTPGGFKQISEAKSKKKKKKEAKKYACNLLFVLMKICLYVFNQFSKYLQCTYHAHGPE